jgi:hypothetical protein
MTCAVPVEMTSGNACDKDGALFQLPLDVSTTWRAYAMALSKPNTSMNITSCGGSNARPKPLRRP